MAHDNSLQMLQGTTKRGKPGKHVKWQLKAVKMVVCFSQLEIGTTEIKYRT